MRAWGCLGPALQHHARTTVGRFRIPQAVTVSRWCHMHAARSGGSAKPVERTVPTHGRGTVDESEYAMAA